MRLNWHYDAEIEAFVTPYGTIRLCELITVASERARGHVNLTGAWRGWKIRNGALIPPGTRIRITPDTLRRYQQWASHSDANQPEQLSLTF
mgnify:CR=1 FL=1